MMRLAMYLAGAIVIAAVFSCAPTLTPWRINAQTLSILVLPWAFSISYYALAFRWRLVSVAACAVAVQGAAYCYAYVQGSGDYLATVPDGSLLIGCGAFVIAYCTVTLTVGSIVGWVSIRVYPLSRPTHAIPVVTVDNGSMP